MLFFAEGLRVWKDEEGSVHLDLCWTTASVSEHGKMAEQRQVSPGKDGWEVGKRLAENHVAVQWMLKRHWEASKKLRV